MGTCSILIPGQFEQMAIEVSYLSCIKFSTLFEVWLIRSKITPKKSQFRINRDPPAQPLVGLGSPYTCK